MVANFMSNSIYIGLSVSFCRSGIKKSCHIISHFDVDSSVYDTSWFFAIKLINLRCLFSGFHVRARNGWRWLRTALFGSAVLPLCVVLHTCRRAMTIGCELCISEQYCVLNKHIIPLQIIPCAYTRHSALRRGIHKKASGIKS